MSMQPEPIVFISHSRVRPEKLEALRAFLREGTAALQIGKPQTRAFLAYLDDQETTLTIVHVFGDPAAMAAHVEGADERSQVASELIETIAIDIYGAPPEQILAGMRRNSGSGTALDIRPYYLGGFLRPIISQCSGAGRPPKTTRSGRRPQQGSSRSGRPPP